MQANERQRRTPGIDPATPAAQLLTGLLFFAALALTFLLYRPGLTGYYLFDDFQNLSALDNLKSNLTVDQVIQFLFHGISSPTGRPVSLATFAMQADDWPGNPEGFLRVNLLLHLLNGTLLFWWLLRLARLLRLPELPGMLVPLGSTVLWLIAPIQVTAVIYIVQRMTELSATFVFLGMLLYLVGRDPAVHGSNRAGVVWMSLGVLVGGVFGTLAKENAALMPLLILALEFTLLARIARPVFWRAWSAVFLIVPVVALAGYLLLTAGPVFDAYAMREFSLWQRLMTEARVLFMYLHKLLMPWPSGIRLLYDDFPVSIGLFQPWTTWISIVGIGGLLGFGWALRSRAPVFAFAVLWFFAAHLLESTVIPLELAFEHRNYQAGVGVWFAVAAGVQYVWHNASARHVRAMLVGLAAAYVLLLSMVTFQITTLWGRPFHMAVWWAEKLPGSRRAQIELQGALIERGFTTEAIELVQEAAARWPDNPAFHLTLLQLACDHPGVAPPIAEILPRIRSTQADVLTSVYFISQVTTRVEEGSCPVVSPEVIRKIVEAAFDNPALLIQRQNLLLLYSRALKLENRRSEARDYFRQAVEVKPAMILMIQGVLDELDAGQLDRAREYLKLAESDPRVRFLDRWSHRNDVESLRKLLELYEAKQALP